MHRRGLLLVLPVAIYTRRSPAADKCYGGSEREGQSGERIRGGSVPLLGYSAQ